MQTHTEAESSQISLCATSKHITPLATETGRFSILPEEKRQKMKAILCFIAQYIMI